MKYGILGTGNVAQVIATKLVKLGHEVMMGSRVSNNENAVNWAKKNGSHAKYGTFADAASFGENVFNCVKGVHSLEALSSADPKNLKGKILIDLSNPYLHKDGHVSLDPKYSGNTCLGEEIQKFLPNTKVVKTLNYLGCGLMTNPDILAEPITGFYCGSDDKAKEFVNKILHDFGWTDTYDLGDISMSRYTEMLGAFWVPVYGKQGNMNWGFRLVKDMKKNK